MIRTAPVAALLVVLALGGTLLGGAPPRTASQVVVRGDRSLGELLIAATADAWRGEYGARPVSIVVDVTPNTTRQARELAAAFELLGDRVRRLDGHWRIGALGRPLGKKTRHPSSFSADVERLLAKETPEPNTVRALGRTLRDFDDRDGIVVYLADWRFEDDEGLESFIRRLRGRGQSFRVIGSEAAFHRGWNDGFFPDGPIALDERYESGIGRRPFGPIQADAPWHGGDAAFPSFPWHFRAVPWEMEFAPSSRSVLGGKAGLEDLGARLRKKASSENSFRRMPLASSFGPWSLMRAAAETGGHYYLYSFNPDGRSDVTYDFARCNLFAPDLRPRKEIAGAARSRPVTAAMLKAWHLIANQEFRLAEITPPVARGGASEEMKYAPASRRLSMGWDGPAGRDQFLRLAEENLDALRKATQILDGALAAPRPSRIPDARYRADAELFRHILHVLRFELGEAVEAAKTVEDDAWDQSDTQLSLVAVTWIEEGRNPDRIRTVRDARNEAAGERVIDERADRLRRYGGTPFGEVVARNRVVTYRVRKVKFDRLPTSAGLGRTPSESNQPRPKTPRPTGGGSSGGGGSSSGGK